MLMGIPMFIDKRVPVDEIWLMENGVKTQILTHDGGPKGGQSTEDWFASFKTLRRINVEKLVTDFQIHNLWNLNTDVSTGET